MKHVDVTWIGIQSQFDDCLGWNKVLYAYVDSTGRIYYIGKADDQTLRQRLMDPDKARMVGILTRNGGQPGGILYGLVKIGGSYSPPSSVISNAEALLIRDESPWGNVIKPTISEDTRVVCLGSWMGRKSTYEYVMLRRIARPVLNASPRALIRPLAEPAKPRPSFRSDMMGLAAMQSNGALSNVMRIMAESKKR